MNNIQKVNFGYGGSAFTTISMADIQRNVTISTATPAVNVNGDSFQPSKSENEQKKSNLWKWAAGAVALIAAGMGYNHFANPIKNSIKKLAQAKSENFKTPMETSIKEHINGSKIKTTINDLLTSAKEKADEASEDIESLFKNKKMEELVELIKKDLFEAGQDGKTKFDVENAKVVGESIDILFKEHGTKIAEDLKSKNQLKNDSINAIAEKLEKESLENGVKYIDDAAEKGLKLVLKNDFIESSLKRIAKTFKESTEQAAQETAK